MVRKTTSLKVEEEFWKKVRIYCINKGIDVSDFVEMALKEEMKK